MAYSKKPSTKKKVKFNNGDNNNEAIQGFLNEINTRYANITVNKLNESDATISRMSSGDPLIDTLLGGGIPKGKIIELYGAPSSGKTTFALKAAAEHTRRGGVVVFIDCEHALDPYYFVRMGGDPDKCYIVQPMCAEEVFQIAKEVCTRLKEVMIIVDSTAAMVPRSELQDTRDILTGVATLPRIMAGNLNALTPLASKSGCTVFFISQTRTQISTMASKGPAKKTSTGGNALKFYASMRIKFIKTKTVRGAAKQAKGQITQITVIKSKTSVAYAKMDWYINRLDPSDYISSAALLAPRKSMVDRVKYVKASEENLKSILDAYAETISAFSGTDTVEEDDGVYLEEIDETAVKEGVNVDDIAKVDGEVGKDLLEQMVSDNPKATIDQDDEDIEELEEEEENEEE